MDERLQELGAYTESLLPMAVEHGLSIIGAVLILIAGWVVANWLAKRVERKTSSAAKIDNTIVPILTQTTRVFILVVTVLAVLGQFGVETTSIVAVMGAAALAVGLALQGTLSNVAAGMMLLVLRPFKVGDVVDVGGTLGVVDSIGFFLTDMHTFDNVGISMPNSRVWGHEIKNLSRFSTRRVDLEFGIGYGDSISQAIELIKEILQEDKRVLDEPEPLIVVSSLGDSSVNIIVRPWALSKDVWPLRYDLLQKVKERFDENGISIPFPQRDIHMINGN